MRTAFDICQPSGNLGEEESALAQCFMAIAGFVRKMSGTSEVDTDTMNRAVSKMVEEALKYNQVESVLESGEEEDIFSPEYFEKLSDVKMPATKLELLVKMLRKQIKVVETDMSQNKWNMINYEAVPSKAMANYNRAFAKHDPIGFCVYKEALNNGKAKINAATMFPYELVKNLENHYQNQVWLFHKLIGMYVQAEYHTSFGRIDMVLQTPDFCYVIEFKFGGTAQEAIDQISRKDYVLPFALDGRKIIRIGISISPETRNISDCLIVRE